MIKRVVDLFDAFRNAMRFDPDGSREDAFNHFFGTVKSDPAYLETLARDYFDRNFAQWRVARVGKSVQLVGTSPTMKRAEVTAERRVERRVEREQLKAEKLAEIRTAVVESFLTLDFIMPNEKKLRDCTGAEVARFGGIFTEIARHVKPTQVVGHHLNAREIKNIVTRYQPEGGSKRRGAAAEQRVSM